METLESIRQWATNDNIRTTAAVIQAFGVIIGAVLAYNFAKRLEKHKFEMKLQEIMHANTQKRRLETLENIVSLMGNILYAMREIPLVFTNHKASVENIEGENIQDWMQRQYAERYKDF